MSGAARGRSGPGEQFLQAKVALQEGDFDQFKALLEKYPRLATEKGGAGCNGRTLLHYACTLAAVYNGDAEFAKIYTKPPADSYGGDVMYHPGVVAVQMLLSKGAPINAREHDGPTPLFVLDNMIGRYRHRLSLAAQGVVAQMREVLLKAGADPMLGDHPLWSTTPRSPYSMAIPGSPLREQYQRSPAMRAVAATAGVPPMAAMALPPAAPSSAPPLTRMLSGGAGTAALALMGLSAPVIAPSAPGTRVTGDSVSGDPATTP